MTANINRKLLENIPYVTEKVPMQHVNFSVCSFDIKTELCLYVFAMVTAGPSTVI